MLEIGVFVRFLCLLFTVRLRNQEREFKTQVCCSFDEGVGEIISGIEKEEHESLKQTHT